LVGCNTSRLRVFENEELREIFALNRDEVRGEWRRLHNEELYDLYSSSRSIFRVIELGRIWWVRNVARMGDMRGAYRVLGTETCGKETTWKANTMTEGEH